MTGEHSKPFKILFLCTGNSARSIMAEYLMRKFGRGRFEPYSAGANAAGKVNPYALRVLKDAFQIDASQARSKSREEFHDARFDFVITVCDRTVEAWPGQPIVAHWPAPDPASFRGNDQETYRHFWQLAQLLRRRIELFCSLPFKSLDRLRLEQATRDIGRQEDAFDER